MKRFTLLGLLLGLGCSTAPAGEPTPAHQSGYLAEVERSEAERDVLRRAAESSDDWLPWERLANAELALAQLTGDLENYNAAIEAVDAAFERAAAGAGPHVTAATVYFSVHRLEAMEQPLDAAEGVIPNGSTPTPAIRALEGDLALQRLEFAEAERLYERSEALDPTANSSFRRAMLAWQQADFETTDALLAEAQERIPGAQPRLRAYFHLQRGILDLDQGRYAEADAHYAQADAVFDGWWLVEEHRAEIAAIEGRLQDAAAVYEEVVAATGSGELHDAYADVLSELGEDAAAREHRALAEAQFRADLAELPEASFGHALPFFLAQAESLHDAEEALALGRQNFALRPNGEAHVLLARALAKTAFFSGDSGPREEAQSLIEAVLGTQFRNAEALAVGSVFAEAAGDLGIAEARMAQALAMNPDIAGDVEDLRSDLGL